MIIGAVLIAGAVTAWAISALPGTGALGIGLAHLDLHCLPAIYHNHPEKIVPAVREAVAKYRPDYAEIFVVYADCGTGGQLHTACAELGVTMLQGPHCYAFFEGNDAFAARDEMTAFYLTDFLVRQFDAFVWEPLGFAKYPDRFDVLRDMYFGHYTKLVYQAQTEDLSGGSPDTATCKRN